MRRSGYCQPCRSYFGTGKFGRKIPDNVLYEKATYTTVASIALQGVRQADLRLGENCVVIGLGLVGQLTIQFLKASGVKDWYRYKSVNG